MLFGDDWVLICFEVVRTENLSRPKPVREGRYFEDVTNSKLRRLGASKRTRALFDSPESRHGDKRSKQVAKCLILFDEI